MCINNGSECFLAFFNLVVDVFSAWRVHLVRLHFAGRGHILAIRVIALTSAQFKFNIRVHQLNFVPPRSEQSFLSHRTTTTNAFPFVIHRPHSKGHNFIKHFPYKSNYTNRVLIKPIHMYFNCFSTWKRSEHSATKYITLQLYVPFHLFSIVHKLINSNNGTERRIELLITLYVFQ